MKFAITDPKAIELLVSSAWKLSFFHWAVVRVLLDTGCHPSNIYDVRIEGDVAQWRRVKNSKPSWARSSSLLKEAVDIIHCRKRMSREWYSHFVKEAAEAAEMPWISSQSLRKTYCLQLLKEGYPETVVAQMMGCGEQLIRSTYSQIAPEDLMKIVASRKVE